MKSFSKKSAAKWLLSGFTASALTISLAGCSQTDDERPALQKTTDASMTETADYVPASAEGPAQNVPEPRLPETVTAGSEEGAQAALEFFWEAETFASITGNSDPLVAVSDDECVFCYESIEGWPQNYQDGYWTVLHGDIEVDVTDIAIPEENAPGNPEAHVYFKLTEPATDFYDEEGNHLAASFESPETKDWFAILNYDATAQIWNIEWVGLEDDVVWEE